MKHQIKIVKMGLCDCLIKLTLDWETVKRVLRKCKRLGPNSKGWNWRNYDIGKDSIGIGRDEETGDWVISIYAFADSEDFDYTNPKFDTTKFIWDNAAKFKEILA